MKESQQKIEIRVEGVSGSNSVKITLDGGENANNKVIWWNYERRQSHN